MVGSFLLEDNEQKNSKPRRDSVRRYGSIGVHGSMEDRVCHHCEKNGSIRATIGISGMFVPTDETAA